MTTLVYRGGATLTFGDGGRRRTVKFDEQFEVGPELAKKLLADPTVERYQAPADVPRGTPAEGEAHEPNKAELRDRAERLGLELPKRATKPEIEKAIAAEDKRLAKEATASESGEGNEGGDATPASDPDATATGEAGTPPSTSTGAVTLGDFPESAKVGRG